MQPKISSFFKQPAPSRPSPQPKSPDPPQVSDGNDNDVLALWEKKKHVIVETYKRRAPKPNGTSIPEGPRVNSEPTIAGRTVNKTKKRSYAQIHLEFGQSDFLLRTCSTCGIKYAPGDEEDEKSHMTFHKDYTLGVQFKGWAKERVISMPSVDNGRIISVIDSDPAAHRSKVQEVLKMMESELGTGWIYHKLCKVYLFISSQRVAGCLVAEPTKEAFKVIPYAQSEQNKQPATRNLRSRGELSTAKEPGQQSTALQFGNIIFQREVVRRVPSASKDEALDESLTGAIYCENEAVPVACGIRAIWVTPSNRRKGIASSLLDAARTSFCTGIVLEHSQIAFSQPTSVGKALASSYMGSRPLLVYKAGN